LDRGSTSWQYGHGSKSDSGIKIEFITLLFCLHQPYDPNQPIEALFDQIEEAISLAAAAQAPYCAAQIVSIADTTLIFAIGMFCKLCRE
jgi:hypothetical protein